MKKRVLVLFLVFLLVLTACGKSKKADSMENVPEMIVVTDNEPEARNAIVRLSLYLNDLNIKGIYDVSDDESFQSFYEGLANSYESVADKLQEKDPAYPKNIQGLYSNEFSELEKLDDVYVLDFTKDFTFEDINLETAHVYSAYNKDIKAKEHVVFEAYDAVFGKNWSLQEASYKKALHPSFFEELDGFQSPLFSHYTMDDGTFIGELPSLTFLSLVNPKLTWVDENVFSSWTGHLLKKDGKYHTLVPEKDFYKEEETELFSLQRFLEFIQGDFKNRLAWTVGEGSVKTEVKFDQEMISFVEAGDTYAVKVETPEDVDYYYHWWYYSDMDDEMLDLELEGWGTPMMEVMLPENLETGTKLHFILELEHAETGHKSLYRRVVEVK